MPPSNEISLPFVFTGGVILKDQVNADLSEIAAKFNAHTHDTVTAASTGVAALNTVGLVGQTADIFKTTTGAGLQVFGVGASGQKSYLTAAVTNIVGSPTKTYPVGTAFFSVDPARGDIMLGPNKALLLGQNKARWYPDGLYEATTGRLYTTNLVTRMVANPSQLLMGSYGPSTPNASTTATGSVSACPTTTVNGSQAADTGTLTVADTSAFPSSGSVQVLDTTSLTNTIAYTGKTSSTLTGCTGGVTGRTLASSATVTGLVTIPVTSTSGFDAAVTVTDTSGIVHYGDGVLQLGDSPTAQFVKYTSTDGTHFYGCSGLTTGIANGATVRAASAAPDLDGFGGGLGIVGLRNGDNMAHWWGMAAENPMVDDRTLWTAGRVRRDYPAKNNRADTSLQAISASINMDLTEAPYVLGFRSPGSNMFAAGGRISIGTTKKGAQQPTERMYANDRGTFQIHNGWLSVAFHEPDQPTCVVAGAGGTIPYSNTGDLNTDMPLNTLVYRVQAYWNGTGTKYTGAASGSATLSGSAGLSGGYTAMPYVSNATSQATITCKRLTGASGYLLWVGHFVFGVGVVWDGYYDLPDPGTDQYANPTVAQVDDGTRTTTGTFTASTAGPATDNRYFGSVNRPYSTVYHDRVRLGVTDANSSWGIDLARTGIGKASLLTQTGALASLVANVIRSTQAVATAATLVDLSAQIVLADTTSAAFTVTLPAAPTTGTTFTFVDAGHIFNTHNLTVGRNGKTIDNVASNLVLSATDVTTTLMYDGTGWRTI